MATARTAPRRAAASSRSTALEPADPATALPAPRTSHLRNAVVLGSVGAGGYGAAPLLGLPDFAGPILVGGLAGAAAIAAIGALRLRRRRLQDRVLEALAPVLGVRHLDRRLVHLDRWTFGWPGHPRRLRIQYAPGAPDNDPGWITAILTVVNSRLLSNYQVVRHDRRRCRIWLAVAKAAEASQPPHSQIRAEKAIRELIGPTTKISDVDLDGEELQAITVSHEAGSKVAAAGYRARVERVITTMMPGRWRARWNLEADTVRFEIRPSLPDSIWLPTDSPGENVDDLLRNYRQVRIGVGRDEDGRELYWYPARVPQAMVIGGTGSGKTSTDQGLLVKITQYGWPVWVLDAKRVEFLAFRDWPNVQIVAGSVPQQVALIRAAWELMEYRYQLIEDGKATVTDFEPLVIFLEEYAEFRSNLMEWYAQIKIKGDPSRPPTLAEVASLVRKARTARIHLVISTQRPDAEFLGGELRDNLGFRISLGRLSPQGAMMTWENPAVGVALPRALTGRAMATHEDGHPVEIQCYRTPDPDAPPGTEEHRLLETIRPKQARWPRLVIIPPETQTDSDSGESTPPTFRDHARARWDLAENRPDLDPLAQPTTDTSGTGRQLASTMASLGITTPAQGQITAPGPTDDPKLPAVAGLGRSHLQVIAQPLEETGDAADHHEQAAPSDAVDAYADYGEPTPCLVRDISVGDLIEVDQDDNLWAVVDEPLEDDYADPGLVALSWRGDGDEAGVLSVPEDSYLSIRRPLEEEHPA